jgi:hypothetical protein
MTLLFSAGMAALAMALEVPYMGFLPMLVAFGLIFAISKMRNSPGELFSYSHSPVFSVSLLDPF